jgi:hypothetical protein
MRKILMPAVVGFFMLAAFVATQSAVLADTTPVLIPLPDTKTVTVVTVEPTKTIETTTTKTVTIEPVRTVKFGSSFKSFRAKVKARFAERQTRIKTWREDIKEKRQQRRDNRSEKNCCKDS